MRAAVMTMVYNEAKNLPIWVDYYAKAVGLDNLLVIDHGSDDGSVDAFKGIGRINLRRSRFSDLERCRFISRIQQALALVNDVIIYTDCDEIIAPDPAKYKNLQEYLEIFSQNKRLCVRPVGLNIFQSRGLEQPLVHGAPILRQRSYCQFDSVYCKPVVTRWPVNWDVGFHHVDVHAAIDPDLYLFHLRDRDYDESLRRLGVTRALEWDSIESAKGLGQHHRYSDAACTEERFDIPDRMLRESAALAFDFSKEVAQIRERYSGFRGPVARIPDRFKDIF